MVKLFPHKKIGSALKSTKGFTLLEVALAVIIGGMLLGLFGEQLIHTIQESKMKTTQYRLDEVNKALNHYVGANNRYVCPANRELRTDENGYGEAAAICTPNAPAPGTAALNGVRTGMVPTRTLNLPDEFGYDAWGSRFIYAVTENMTNGLTFRPEGPCLTSAGNGGPCLQVDSNTRLAAYAIVSVGPNRKGGFNIYGIQTPCSGSANDADLENCDDDHMFTDVAQSSSSSHTGASNYSDDIIIFSAGSFGNVGFLSGAIVPFRLAQCPKGWEKVKDLEGHIVVGRGSFSNPAPLSGTPPVTYAKDANNGGYLRYGTAVGADKTGITEYHNYPPFIAYTYCVKS